MGSLLTDSQTACPLTECGSGFRMARQPRFEYPGAGYHLGEQDCFSGEIEKSRMKAIRNLETMLIREQ